MWSSFTPLVNIFGFLLCYHHCSFDLKRIEKKPSVTTIGYITEETRLAVSSLIRSPRCFGHFILFQRNVHSFLFKKTVLMQPNPTCVMFTRQTSYVHLFIVNIS